MNKKKIVFLPIVIVLLTFLFFKFSNNNLDITTAKKMLASCGTPSSDASYRDCVVKYTILAIKDNDLNDGMDLFENYLEENPNLLIVCHDIAHKIGYEAYLLYKEGSIIYDKKYCAYGYYHGIFQGFMEKNNSVIDFAYDLCEKLDNNKVLVECVHGIGHAAYHNDEDAKLGLVECGKIPDNAFIGACANGVMMAYQANLAEDKISFDYTDCYNNIKDIVLGCITNSVYSVVKKGLLLTELCNSSDEEIFNNCLNGYAKGLSDSECVSTYCLGSEKLDITKLDKYKLQFESCNNYNSCAKAYGFFSYQSYKNEAAQLCDRYFTDDKVGSCKDGYKQASNCVSNFVNVLHHYRPCRLSEDKNI
jgi:hypothetical protein